MTESDRSSLVGVIETDAFCDKCGFNLHTQKVWRDERLGILLCRCPECGAHQAAGLETSSTSAWLRRFALLGLLCWFGLALTFVVGSFFLFFGHHFAMSETMTVSRLETRDTREYVYQQGNQSTQGATQTTTWVKYNAAYGNQQPEVVAESDVVYRTRLVHIYAPWDDVQPRWTWYERSAPLLGLIVIVACFEAAVFAVGCVFAAGSWFWRPGRRWSWLLLPMLSAFAAFTLIEAEALSNQRQNIPSVGGWIRGALVGIILASHLLVLAAALAMGRPLVRLLLNIFIPPKSRQMFAFLWHCDGKTMPTPRR